MPLIHRIVIDFIPHEHHRYDTLGDWYYVEQPDGTQLQIMVTHTPGKPLYEQAIAVHELVEALLCNADGVSQATVDGWDMATSAGEEPGEEPGCPYRDQHATATTIEKIFLRESGEAWWEYENYLDSLGEDESGQQQPSDK